jgi:hypothetical protein
MHPIRSYAIIAAALFAALATHPARGAEVEDFYKGKTVSLLIGYSVGGGYDAYGRLLARHLGKHIPGNPSVVPQNMTGAGSLKAANYLYSVAPKDGTVIGTFSRSQGIAPLLDKAEFDSRKFTWLGSVTDEVSLCVTRHDAPVKTFKELLVTPAALGSEGAGSDPNIFALLYRNVFGAKIKLVTGYPGTNEIQLATERGEVDGLCGLSWSTLKGRYPHWLTGKSQHPGAGRDPEAAGIAGRSVGERAREGAGSGSDSQSVADRTGDGAAIRGPARHSRRSPGYVDRSLRAHDRGSGFSCRGTAARLRSPSRQRGQARRAAGGGLCHAQGRHRQSRQGHVGMTRRRWVV